MDCYWLVKYNKTIIMNRVLIIRICLFLIGCMGARFALTYVAKTIRSDWLPYMGYAAFIVATGFAVIYFMGWRKTGAEVRGAPIWWNSLRPIHAALWLIFGLLAIQKNKYAWTLLLADTLIGLAAFVAFHTGILFQ
jgi:hypothetical protein